MTRQSVVCGEFSVREVAGRNRNFRVARGDDRSLFVKQIKEFDQTTVDSLRREAVCYQLTRDGRCEALAEIAPRFVDYDPVRHLLVVELIVDAHTGGSQPIWSGYSE